MTSDGNCRVDLDDIAVLSSQWLESGWNEQAGLCPDGPALDWTGPDGQPDCTVNLYELAELAAAWQECYACSRIQLSIRVRKHV